MPLQKLEFKPGVNRESTSYANEGGWFECNKIRFRSGQVEKLGGWARDTGTLATANSGPPTGVLWGAARSMWNWVTLSGYNLLGIGTNLKYYIQNGVGGAFYDATPLRLPAHTGITNAFTTTFESRTVRVNDPDHGAQTGDFVTISGGATVSGIAMNGEYQIAYLSANTYNITTTGAPASGSTTAGTATFTYQITSGNEIYTTGVGWGAGNWGGSVTGVASTTITAAINSTISVIPVANTAGFATTPGQVLIDSELITYTSITLGIPGSLNGCVRGANGTVAASHSSGALVQLNTTFIGWGRAAPSGLGIGLQMRIWSQSNFGENLVFAARGGPMYYWAVNANPTVFDRGVEIKAGATVDGALVDPTCPDTVNLILVSDASRFVFAFGCNDPTNTYATSVFDPMQIRWSDQESFSVWQPATTNQAGDYRLSRGSSIVAAIQTRQETLVFTDSALYGMQYLGPPYVWGFQVLEDNISIAGPNAVATASNVTYWMGMDKFYMYSGRTQTLPSTLREYVFSDINLTQQYQVNAGTNEGYNEVWWSYCSANSTVVDRYVVYNYLENVWHYGDWLNSNGVNQGRTAWLDSALRTAPMACAYGVAGGTSNATLVYHETGVDDGAGTSTLPIYSYVQSSDFDIGDGHNYGFVWRMIPDLTFDGSIINNPSADFTVRPRRFPGSNYGASQEHIVTSIQNYQTQRTYTVQQFTEQVYVRIRGRQMAFKISSNDAGVQWQLGVCRIEIRPDGRKA
jgi:hypothetical protein